MNKILVWDIPTRLFHWAFAASLTGAIVIGFLTDDDDPLFMTHMLSGIVALFLLIVRPVMGLVGSRYARFSSFPLSPRGMAVYFVSAVFAKTRRYAGNNPGSTLAAVLMFLLVPASAAEKSAKSMKPLPGQCWQSSRFISRASSLTPSATAWIGGLFANHDAANASVRIPLLGATIQLGENESGENEHGESRPREHEDDDDDD